MDDRDERIERYQRRREAFLTFLLTFMVGGGFLLFMIFVTGGFFFWVLMVCAGLALLGWLQYLLWGRRFSKAVEGEREELELQEQLPDWETTPPPGERRF